MASRDKEKSFQDKLKQMFKRGNLGHSKTKNEFTLTDVILRDLGKDSPYQTRIKVVKELSDIVQTSKLENKSIEKLWDSIQDIFSKNQATELRHAAFNFLQCLIRGQFDKLFIMRAQFFRFIKYHENPEDTAQKLQLFNMLTDGGKDITYFEEQVGPFLLNWLPDVTKAGKIDEYLATLQNVIKYNVAYIEGYEINGIIQHLCIMCCSINQPKTVISCLEIVETIVAYGDMPPESLPQVIGVLCRTVNVESYCQTSWKVMRIILGTHLGHSTMYTMCRILIDPILKSDMSLLRGAVFYIHMALWGTHMVPKLHCPPSSVLPSILQAVKSNHPAVSYEAILGIQHLVNKHGIELQIPAWSVILDILLHIIKESEVDPIQPPNNLIAGPLHDILNTIEKLIEMGSYGGSIGQFYSVVEECANDRPETSVLRLILHISETIMPTEHHWLTNLNNLLSTYFRTNIRTNIRLKVLDILSNVVKLNRRQYEDELIDRIVIPHMLNVTTDTDIIVRASVAKLLVDLCISCETKRCLEMLEILEKMLYRPFEVYSPDNIPIDESEFCDIKCLVSGLIQVFTAKIHKLPSNHAIKIYNMLVHFLELHYDKPKVFEHCNQVRYMIFDCFLKMRADARYHLGCPETDGKVQYSSYLCVTNRTKERGGSLGSPPPQSPAITQQPPCTVTLVSVHKAFKVFMSCLKNEKDWEVLSLVLQEMPKVLQNKSLILSKHGNNELDLLVDILCSMITDKSLNLPESLNKRVSKQDFHSAILQVLVSLPPYHAYLDQARQQKMIRCLIKSITNSLRNSPKQCIEALTICTLEMRDIMVKMLPELLLNLSKISATVYIAIPVLEFLSTLTQLPKVFASFVDEQYMAVFAISFPYTNPFNYNHYTVSLAHYVIAVWFLKCRLSFRKNFVKFITSGLQTNVLTPFEETNLLKTDLSKLNLDSSDRKRSSSLTEQGSRRRSATVSARMEGNKSTLTISNRIQNTSVHTFYEELTETCIDLMARYAFSPCSALPRRLPTAEFLLNNGQSMSWLVGNKLVTVTTSGCSQKVLKHGLCDKCWSYCNTLNFKSNGVSSSGKSNSQTASRQNSNDKSHTNTSASSPVEENKKSFEKLEQLPSKLQQLTVVNGNRDGKEMCACWCQGWAEIYVRRPTGDMSWVMRIQNQLPSQHSIYDFPVNELSTLYMPLLNQGSVENGSVSVNSSEEYHKKDVDDERFREPPQTPTVPVSVPGSPTKQSPSRQSSRDSIDEELEYTIYDDGSKSRNPVRRSNSSPEMSNWKNPLIYAKQDSDDKSLDDESTKKCKGMRVSCEAIPEEMAGTTPPAQESFLQKSSQQQQQSTNSHPSLLSCHSFPESSSPKENTKTLKPYQTVPPSPNVTGNTLPPSFTKSSPLTNLNCAGGEKVLERPNNLPSLSSLAPLSSKPPQSPTQTSPRLSRHSLSNEGYELQKNSSAPVLERTLSLAREKAKERKNSGSMERLTQLDPNQAQKRDRVHTISVMSPAPRKLRQEQLRQLSTRPKEAPKSGINPSFVFLQLYHKAYFGDSTERPQMIGSSQMVQRAVQVLDSIPPYETHKIGIIYIKEGQCNNEVEILKNRFGSLRYVEFLQNVGTLIKLQDVDPQIFFLGGLDQGGDDGKFAYIWQDDVVKVIFHVATMMPNKESEKHCNNKKRHIGNNNVIIVYNESGEEYNINTIKSQFNFAAVIIQPLDHNLNRIVVKYKEELTELVGSTEPKIVSDQNVAILSRQLALHANLASLVQRSLRNNNQDPYASNWLERLRKIKNIRHKIMQEAKSQPKNEQMYASDDSCTTTSTRRKQMEDFTEYT